MNFNIPLTLGIISDIHIHSGNPEESVTKFESALSQLKERAGTLHGILAVGDLADHKCAADIELFKETYEKIFNPEEVPLIHCYGDDHDFVWSDTEASARIREYNAIFGERYFRHDIDKDAIPLGNRHAVIGGYHILALEPMCRRPILYSNETKCWLDKTLRTLTADEPGRYVIVMTHPMLTGTVYGSECGGGAWATEDLTEILSRYPQVIAFSGHLHFPLNDPRSIMQTAFTAIGTGAVRYLGLETDGFSRPVAPMCVPDSHALSQGLLARFFADGSAGITRIDFAKKAEIGKAWLLPHPEADGSHLTRYTRLRGDASHNRAPELDDFIILPEEGDTPETWTAHLHFPAGTDDEFIHHYVAAFGETGAEEPRRRRIVTDFYSAPNPADMRAEWDFRIGELVRGKRYTFTLTAVDSWDAQSAPITKEICHR